jgi:hypothetical protein
MPLTLEVGLSDRCEESSHVQDPSRGAVSPSLQAVPIGIVNAPFAHPPQSLQRMKAVVVELQEIAQEEEAVVTEFIRLTEDDTGKVSLPSSCLARNFLIHRIVCGCVLIFACS